MHPLSIEPLGDTALLVRNCRDAARLAAAAQHQGLAGVTDVVPAFDQLGVYFDPPQIRLSRPEESPAAKVTDWLLSLVERPALTRPKEPTHTIPVCYAPGYAPDLDRVAQSSGLSPTEVIRRHQQAEYRVAAIGFTPGFGYLQGLPAELHTPRLKTPRTAAPAGSLGIGGPFTGLYPTQSPGGWNLIGRSPTTLFDLTRELPATWAVGDKVCFEEISAAEFEQLLPSSQDQPSVVPEGPAVLRVLQPGVQTTVQDVGRVGHRRLGVSRSGAMDTHALQLANLLVGNRPSAPALEGTLVGPKLECLHDVTIAVAGAVPRQLGGQRRIHMRAGQTIDFGLLPGGRVYIAVAGGIAANKVLGSAATDVVAGIGGSTLQKGELVYAAAKGRTQPASPSPAWRLAEPRQLQAQPPGLRYLPGPQASAFTPAYRQALETGEFVVGKASSRMGVRLSGQLPPALELPDMTSQPVVTGAIQVPPSGQPIVLGADCQTLGGYPVVGCVIAADWGRLGQCRPGDRLTLCPVTLDQAEAALREQRTQMQITAAGIAAQAQ